MTFSWVDGALDGAWNPYPSSTGYTIEDTFLLSNPIRDGEVFKWWKFVDSDTVYPTLIIINSMWNKTVEAVWWDETYPIVYHLDGWVNSDQNPETYLYGEGVDSFADPSKRWYSFSGWSPSSISSSATWTQVITASWTLIEYPIHYNLNSGTNSDQNPSYYSIESGDIVLEDPSRDGYNFAGWYEWNTILSWSVGERTFTARWEAISYPITYSGMDGAVNNSLNPSSYTIEQDINLLPPTKKDYIFKWWTPSDSISSWSMWAKQFTATWSGDEVEYYVYYYAWEDILGVQINTWTAGDDITLNQSDFRSFDWYTTPTVSKTCLSIEAWKVCKVTWYAKSEFTLTFKSDDSTVYYTTGLVFDSEITSIPSDPSKNGWTFAWWDKAIPDRMPAKNVTITAKWTQDDYKITYTNTKWVENLNSWSYSYWDEFEFLPLSKSGYHFAGWTPAGIAADNTWDVVVTANWTLDSYTVSFTWDETDALSPISYTIESGAFTLPVLADRDGYRFLGWTGDGYSIPAKEIRIPAGSMWNKEFTANWEKEVYTITYNLNWWENHSSNPSSYSLQDSDIVLESPSREWYQFSGWAPSDRILANSTGDRVFTAEWSGATSYEIHYNNLSWADNSMNPDSYTINDFIQLKNPIRDGYNFAGWAEWNLIIKWTTGEKTFTAQWEVKNYSITYNLNGWENSDQNPHSYTIEDSDITIQSGSRQGYIFSGWTEWNIISAHSTGNKTFTAEWTPAQYSITYLNVDNAGALVPSSFTIQSAVDLPTVVQARDGYNFAGWYQLGQRVYQIKTWTHENQEFVADWTLQSYNLTYSWVDGLVNTNPSTYTIESNITLSNVSKPWYTFKWWKLGDAEPVIWLKVNTWNLADRTYEAIFSWNSIYYYVKYFDEDGTVIKEKAIRGTVGQSVTITLEDIPWYDKPMDTDTVTIEPNLVVEYEYSKKSYTITFETDGWTQIAPIQWEYDSSITAPSNPTKDGFTFAGWDQIIPEKMPSHDMTINAIWTNNQYSIVYSGVQWAVNNNSWSYNHGESFPFNAPSKDGYNFIKWMLGDDEISWISADMTWDKLITAIWSPIQYHIYYDDETIDYTIESEDFRLPMNPIKTGYTFLGWTGADHLLPIKEILIKKWTFGNQTYNSNWEIETYSISYDLDGWENSVQNPASYTVESDVINLQSPVKNGYTFAGWTPSDTIPHASTWDRVFTATWDLDSYDIIYTGVDGADNSMNTGSYTVNDFVQLKNPIKTGYTFAGWTEWNYISKWTTGTQTFTANWQLDTYTITYYMNGWENSAQNPVSYTVESGAIQLQTPSKEWYTFSMWSPTDSIPAHSVGNKTFIAYWEANTWTDYKVIHVKQNLNQEYDLTDVSLVYEETLHGTTDTKVVPAAKEYSWFTKAQEQEITILPDGSAVVEYRYPRKSYSFTLENVDGVKTQWTSVNKDYLYESEITLSAQSETWYTWQSWEITSWWVTTTNSNQNIVFTMPATAVSVKPILSHNEYTISFNSNGWTPSVIPSQTWHYAETLIYPSVSKQWHVFQWWYEWSQRYDWSTKLPDRNVNLVAMWTQWKVWVTVNHYVMWLDGQYPATPTDVEIFEAESSTIFTWEVKNLEWFTLPEEKSVVISPDGSAVIDYYYERNKYNLTLNQATWFSYSALSWSNDFYYGSDITVNGNVMQWYTWSWWNGLGEDGKYAANAYLHFTMPSNDLNITPIIKTNVYKVIFKDGQTALSQISVEYLDNIPLPATPSKVGYTFAWWKNLPDDGKMPADDLELEAQWTRNGSSGWGGGWWGGWGWSSKTVETNTHGSAEDKPATWDIANISDDQTDLADDKIVDSDTQKSEESEKSDSQVSYDQESIDAYTWAKWEWITSMPTIEDARMDEWITREELAKMMVVYMSKILGKKPVKKNVPKYWDVSVKARWQELYDYTILAYQYQIMGINANGTPIRYFNPEWKVTRAEFATVLSRVLYGSKYNQKWKYYYKKHIQALQDAWILTETTPTIQEVRWWIMLMLYRSWREKQENK